MARKKPTPLIDAVRTGDAAKVETALQSGASLSEKDGLGRDPLAHAVMNRSENITRLLLNAGSSLEAVDQNGWTALHYAAQVWSPVLVRLLVSAGASVGARDKYGNTPLSRAVFVSNGRGEVIEALLSLGADPDAKNDSGVSPRILADTIANYDVKQFMPH